MADSEDTHVQIARLREQVEALMRDRVTPAMADVAGRAEQPSTWRPMSVRGQAEMVTSKVREQPLLAVLIAAAIGYALGRVDPLIDAHPPPCAHRGGGGGRPPAPPRQAHRGSRCICA